MNTKIFNSLLLVVCGILFCFIVADINGKWTGNINYNGNNIPLTFDFKAEDGILSGTTETPLGISEIKDGKIDKDVMTFKIDLNGDIAVHTANVYADSINMKIKYQGMDYMTTLKRSKAQ